MHAQAAPVEVDQRVGPHQRPRLRPRGLTSATPGRRRARLSTVQLAFARRTGVSVHEPAVAQRAAAVGDAGGLQVVGDEQHGRVALVRDRAQQLDDLRLRALSRFPVGSSARISRGSPASARAIATRWRSPPESCSGVRCGGRRGRPARATAARGLGPRACPRRPAGA